MDMVVCDRIWFRMTLNNEACRERKLPHCRKQTLRNRWRAHSCHAIHRPESRLQPPEFPYHTEGLVSWLEIKISFLKEN